MGGNIKKILMITKDVLYPPCKEEELENICKQTGHHTQRRTFVVMRR